MRKRLESVIATGHYLSVLSALCVSKAGCQIAPWASASNKKVTQSQTLRDAEVASFPRDFQLRISRLQNFGICWFHELYPRAVPSADHDQRRDSNLILLHSADSTSFPGHLPMICCRYWLEVAYCAFTRPFTHENHPGYSGFPDVSNRRSVADRAWLVHLFGMHNGGGSARI